MFFLFLRNVLFISTVMVTCVRQGYNRTQRGCGMVPERRTTIGWWKVCGFFLGKRLFGIVLDGTVSRVCCCRPFPTRKATPYFLTCGPAGDSLRGSWGKQYDFPFSRIMLCMCSTEGFIACVLLSLSSSSSSFARAVESHCEGDKAEWSFSLPFDDLNAFLLGLLFYSFPYSLRVRGSLPRERVPRAPTIGRVRLQSAVARLSL
jgi:hypothetical protein